MPGGLSAVPTLYQTQCATTGARWFATTTTCMPLSSVKVSGWNTPAAARAATRFRAAPPVGGRRGPDCHRRPSRYHGGQGLAAGALGDHAAACRRRPAQPLRLGHRVDHRARSAAGAALEVQDEQEAAVVEVDQLAHPRPPGSGGCRASASTWLCASSASSPWLCRSRWRHARLAGQDRLGLGRGVLRRRAGRAGLAAAAGCSPAAAPAARGARPGTRPARACRCPASPGRCRRSRRAPAGPRPAPSARPQLPRPRSSLPLARAWFSLATARGCRGGSGRRRCTIALSATLNAGQ